MSELENRGKAFAAPGIVVYYNVSKCIDAAECVRGLPDVFKPGERPWIRVERARAESIAEVVRRCPTGALQYELENGPTEQPDSQATVSPQPDGPLFVRGDIAIQIGDQTIRTTRAALCRCGQSSNKPLCDGTHAKIGWRSDEDATVE